MTTLHAIPYQAYQGKRTNPHRLIVSPHYAAIDRGAQAGLNMQPQTKRTKANTPTLNSQRLIVRPRSAGIDRGAQAGLRCAHRPPEEQGRLHHPGPLSLSLSASETPYVQSVCKETASGLVGSFRVGFRGDGRCNQNASEYIIAAHICSPLHQCCSYMFTPVVLIHAHI